MKALELPVVARVDGRNHAVEAFRILQEALTVGQFPAGSRLPGERLLAAQLGVSRATLRATGERPDGHGNRRGPPSLWMPWEVEVTTTFEGVP